MLAPEPPGNHSDAEDQREWRPASVELISARALWTLARSGSLLDRLRANRDGVAGIRLHLAGAAVDTGLLDALVAGRADTSELARRMDARDSELLESFLRVAAVAGLVRRRGNGWELARHGRAIVDDDLVRAVYEAFPGFHTTLYRDLRTQLSGGPPRRDVAEHGALIARVSVGFEPFVERVVARLLAEHAPRRVLDVGCGAGLQLASMLDTVPRATGVGIDVDAGAVELARRTLRDRGLEERGSVLHTGLRAAVDDRPAPLAEPFDLAVLANVIYYVPREERTPMLRDVAALLRPGGVLVLVTTLAAPQLFSRHFDLLLRAQEGGMSLSDADELLDELTAAGFRPASPRPIAPGMPVVTVSAVR